MMTIDRSGAESVGSGRKEIVTRESLGQEKGLECKDISKDLSRGKHIPKPNSCYHGVMALGSLLTPTCETNCRRDAEAADNQVWILRLWKVAFLGVLVLLELEEDHS